MKYMYVPAFVLTAVAFGFFGETNSDRLRGAVVFLCFLMAFLWAMVPGAVPMLCFLSLVLLLWIGAASRDKRDLLVNSILAIPAGIRLTQYIITTINQ